MRDDLSPAFAKFLEEGDPARKQAAGHDLIRAIFGADAIADDTVRCPAETHGPGEQPE